MITRPKKMTGGSGDDKGGKGNDRYNQDNERIRNYNIGMLHRVFNAQPEITPSQVINAMVKRWGKPYHCYLLKQDNNVSLCITPASYDRNLRVHETEVLLVVELLNTYGLGSGFVDFIKYDTTTLKDPAMCHCDQIVSLNIPTAGDRLVEW